MLMTRIFEGRLHVHYGQAYVESSASIRVGLEDTFLGQTNGLCGAAAPGMLFLLTGLHTGSVGFTLDVLDAPPPLDQSREEIVEVSFIPSSGTATVSEWEGTHLCEIPLCQSNYRVRYCARNMERGKEVDSYVEGESPSKWELRFASLGACHPFRENNPLR